MALDASTVGTWIATALAAGSLAWTNYNQSQNRKLAPAKDAVVGAKLDAVVDDNAQSNAAVMAAISELRRSMDARLKQSEEVMRVTLADFGGQLASLHQRGTDSAGKVEVLEEKYKLLSEHVKDIGEQLRDSRRSRP